MIRYQLSMALVPIPNNINLITGNQPIMATIFRLLFIDHINDNMSNAVISLSAPLAQCVKHRSSNQTLTGSNLSAIHFFFFFFFFFFCYHNKPLFFLHSFLWKGTRRQRSGNGAIRKRFPLQKPRWEKTKPTIRYLYHETYRKPNEQLFSQ